MFRKSISNGHTRITRHVLRVFRGLSIRFSASILFGWVEVPEKDGVQREGLANIWWRMELKLQWLQWNYFDWVSASFENLKEESDLSWLKFISLLDTRILIEDAIIINIFFFRHADGSIKFWDASAGTLQVLYKLKTAKLFEKGRTRSLDSEEDPLAIQLIFLCPESRKLAIAGSGRHVVLFKFKKVESMSEVVVSN